MKEALKSTRRLHRLQEIVQKMRHHQRQHFKLSKIAEAEKKRHHLAESKRHERQVDEYLAALELGEQAELELN